MQDQEMEVEYVTLEDGNDYFVVISKLKRNILWNILFSVVYYFKKLRKMVDDDGEKNNKYL